MKKRDTLFEFLRYAVVGGLAAVVDMAVNYLMLYHVFSAGKDDKTYVAISVAVGFIAGLVVNFILSNIFFFIYVAVGVVGFGITELLTLLGTRFIGDHGLWYLLLSCVVKGIVLIWNYIGRKLFVYRGR